MFIVLGNILQLLVVDILARGLLAERTILLAELITIVFEVGMHDLRVDIGDGQIRRDSVSSTKTASITRNLSTPNARFINRDGTACAAGAAYNKGACGG